MLGCASDGETVNECAPSNKNHSPGWMRAAEQCRGGGRQSRRCGKASHSASSWAVFMSLCDVNTAQLLALKKGFACNGGTAGRMPWHGPKYCRSASQCTAKSCVHYDPHRATRMRTTACAHER